MNYKIIPTQIFEKELKTLKRKYPSLKADIGQVIEEFQNNPKSGIPLGYDCFKIRVSIKSKGKGKSGGGRLITCVKITGRLIYLVSVYDKSAQETIREKKLIYYLKLSGLL